MQFTVLGHACMLVEERGDSLLIDPWLVGSCYWRSWWNFPECDSELIKKLKPTAIYLTHLHWDHFHSPTLRLFDRNTKIYIPKIPTLRMVRDLRAAGFKNINEIPHGASSVINSKLKIYSYQFGLGVDSALVITNGKTVLFNANDCKLFGLPLRQVTNKFKSIDFVFRSHSSASALPYCLKNYPDKEKLMRSPVDYAEEFAGFANVIRAKYAVPFASNHCFLHRETLKFNDSISDPGVVQSVFQSSHSELIIMPPESKWSEDAGFQVRHFDYSNKLPYLNMLARKYSGKLEGYYVIEDNTEGRHDLFVRYFKKFLSAVPSFLLKDMGKKVLFKVFSEKKTDYWTVDFIKREVGVGFCDDASYEIEVHANVINDCVRKKMFSVWTASKRLIVTLAGEAELKSVSAFFSFLDMFELEMFPLSNFLSPRYVGVYMRRWREFFEAIRFVITYKILKRPFSPAKLFRS